MHLQPRRLGDGAQHRHGRALAVGPGHMDHRRQPPLRIAQRRAQPLHAAKRQVDQFRVQRPQALEGGVVGSEVVGHGFTGGLDIVS